MGIINLAADYGWGPYTFLLVFVIVTIVSTIGIIIVALTGRTKKPQTFASKRGYEFEKYWAIGTAAVLIWLWIISYPWIPPVAFNAVDDEDPSSIQVVNITAGQWFWVMTQDDDNNKLNAGERPHVSLIAGQPVKFVARSLDVNHGFGIFDGSDDGSPILLQMQVIPELDNVFYYTFKKPGTYFVRCLEYCGYAHPYMTSQIEVTSPSPPPPSAEIYNDNVIQSSPVSFSSNIINNNHPISEEKNTKLQNGDMNNLDYYYKYFNNLLSLENFPKLPSLINIYYIDNLILSSIISNFEIGGGIINEHK
jgi:cytochrome c oxidase subunit 2